MSSFDVCYNWMMDNEDAARAYAQVPDAPPGAFAISGINSAAWPEDYAAIAARVQPLRGFWVELFYRTHFWEYAPIKSWYAQLTSDEVAKRVFDASVNMGSVAAVRCLQQAISTIEDRAPGNEDFNLSIDGVWGQITVREANDTGPGELVSEFQQARVAHYQAIAAAKPADAVYLAAWTARALR
jgi:lysozyme family protein